MLETSIAESGYKLHVGRLFGGTAGSELERSSQELEQKQVCLLGSLGKKLAVPLAPSSWLLQNKL